MKKSSFIAMVLGTVSIVMFAIGMCMALIPEWDAFEPGIIFGCIGPVSYTHLKLSHTVIVHRSM